MTNVALGMDVTGRDKGNLFWGGCDTNFIRTYVSCFSELKVGPLFPV